MPKTSWPQGTKSRFLLFLLFGNLGCAEQDPLVSPDDVIEAQIQDVVGGQAATYLTPGGTFSLAVPPDTFNGRRTITADRAKELASVWMAVEGRQLQPTWIATRGSPIEIESLSIDDRVYFVESPLGAVPGNVPTSLIRHFGPHYIVRFREGAYEAITLAVSAFSTELDIVDGRIMYNVMDNGADFVPEARTPSAGQDVPVSPEAAAIFAFQTLGQRVVEVPYLLSTPRYTPQSGGVWMVKLERPQQVVTKHTSVVRKTDVVGVANVMINKETREFGLILIIPSTDQPAGIPFRVPLDAIDREYATGFIPLRPGRALAWDTVSPLSGVNR